MSAKLELFVAKASSSKFLEEREAEEKDKLTLGSIGRSWRHVAR